MKNSLFAKSVLLLAALLSPAAGRCAYPTLDEARAIFDSERANRPHDASHDGEISRFSRRVQEPSAKDDIRAVESVALDALEAVKVRVSTNAVEASVGIDAICRPWIGDMAANMPFVDFVTNAEACLKLANYVGSVHTAEYPQNLVSEAMPIPIMCSLNGSKLGEERLRQLERENARRLEMREKMGVEYELQARVFRDNAAVEGFRRQLLAVCGRSVVGCRGTMTDSVFVPFTNEVVRVSGASEKEQDVLFRELRRLPPPSERTSSRREAPACKKRDAAQEE